MIRFKEIKTIYFLIILSPFLWSSCSTWSADVSSNKSKAYIDFESPTDYLSEKYGVYTALTYEIYYNNQITKKSRNQNICQGWVARFIVDPGEHTFDVKPTVWGKYGKIHKVKVMAYEDKVVRVQCKITIQSNNKYRFWTDIRKPVPFYVLKPIE